MWAFGVVLMEMLTRRQTFGGETVSHVIASVLKDAPDWTALPPHTPTAIRTLLRRCLENDRRRRLADIADARFELDEALTPAAETPTAARTSSRSVASVSLVLGAIAGALIATLAAWAWMRPAPIEPWAISPSRPTAC